jgi:hypothetical protein
MRKAMVPPFKLVKPGKRVKENQGDISSLRIKSY